MTHRKTGLVYSLVVGVLATLTFFLLTSSVDFTFLADDWGHLAAAQKPEPFFHLSRFLSRVPVWSIVTWALFRSLVLETTWAPMYLFFFLHAFGLALIAGWLRSHAQGAEPDSPRWVFVTAAVILSMSPITYEILYWPTCMAYTLGLLLLGLSLWASGATLRGLLLALSFLTYETFVLPALCLLAAPWLAGRTGTRRLRLETTPSLTHSVGVWFGALAVTLLVRSFAGLFVGSFSHKTVFTLSHVVDKLVITSRELFTILFFGEGINVTATLAQGLLVLVLLWLTWNRIRWFGLLFLVLCFASTAVYWVLEYPAIRAVYGSQSLFLAVLVWLVTLAAERTAWRPVLASALLLTAAGYVEQSGRIFAIKSENAALLRAQEQELARWIRECESPCVIQHGDLNTGLEDDWVLHPDYWPRYLEYLQTKYGPGKSITFQLGRITGPPGKQDLGPTRADFPADLIEAPFSALRLNSNTKVATIVCLVQS